MSELQRESQTEVQEAPKFFVVDASLLQATVNYLGSRPYSEVAGLIEGIKKSQPVNVEQRDPEASELKEVKEDFRTLIKITATTNKAINLH